MNAALLGVVLPLSLLGAISPVLFVNAETIRAGRGRGPAVSFLIGCVLVLVVLGAASSGVLGAQLANTVDKQIASRTVDAILGGLLLCYGGYLLLRLRPAERARPRSGERRSELSFGVLSMATNYTTLPLFVAATQHIGAARPSVPVAALLLTIVIAITALPAWLPLALGNAAPALLHRLTRRRPTPADRGTKRRHKVSIGALIPVVACIAGGVLLIGHAVLGH